MKLLGIGWRILVFVLLWGVLCAPLMFVMPLLHRPEWSPLLLESFGALFIIMATWVMAKVVDRRSLSACGLAPNRLVDVFIATALGALWLVITAVVLWSAGWIRLHRLPTANFALVVAVLITGLNAFSQEALFRGYPFFAISSRGSALSAILVTSLAFCAVHLPAANGKFIPILNVGLAGLFFSLARLSASNLWVPFGLHFGWNLMLGPILGAAVSGKTAISPDQHVITIHGPAMFTGGDFGLEGGLVTTLTTTAGIGVLLFLRRRRLWRPTQCRPSLEGPR